MTETAVAGWDLTGLTCAGDDDSSVTPLSDRKATLDIEAGETVVCTFTNRRKPEIKVIKDIVPDTDTGKFNLKIDSTVFNNGGPGYGDNGTTGFQQVSTGSHTVSEAGNGTTNLSRLCLQGRTATRARARTPPAARTPSPWPTATE